MLRWNRYILAKLGTWLALLALVGQAPATFAQTAIPVPEMPSAIRLYPGMAPGSAGDSQVEQWEQSADGRRVRNVSVPVLIPVLPAAGKENGTAVIVAPGGAFRLLAIDNEGFAVAEWLAQQGISAFVLKYRVMATPAAREDFIRERQKGMASGAAIGTHPLAVDDGRRAVQLVRENAARWGLRVDRIGLIGFSAGAMTTLEVVLGQDAATRPDFAAMIYGPMGARAVPSDAPPLFVALAANDPLFGAGGFGLVSSWQKADRPVELHMFEQGGHGFGMTKKGLSSDLWPEQFLAWLRTRGIVAR
jgi:acetyl esterase/lipase